MTKTCSAKTAGDFSLGEFSANARRALALGVDGIHRNQCTIMQQEFARELGEISPSVCNFGVDAACESLSTCTSRSYYTQSCVFCCCQPDALVYGVVRQVMTYGLFVELNGELRGLVPTKV